MCATAWCYLVNVTEVTSGLTESNGSLLPDGWLKSYLRADCLYTRYNEYRKTLPFSLHFMQLCDAIELPFGGAEWGRAEEWCVTCGTATMSPTDSMSPSRPSHGSHVHQFTLISVHTIARSHGQTDIRVMLAAFSIADDESQQRNVLSLHGYRPSLLYNRGLHM